MSNYYVMEQIYDDDYIKVIIPEERIRGCDNSEFQYISSEPINISVDTGVVFSDFIMSREYIPVISDKLKQMFDEFGVMGIRYVRVNIDYFGRNELYWMAIPSRISCVDPEFLDEDMNFFDDIEDIKIISDRVGNYHIFKLYGVGNQEIIITDKFFHFLQSKIISKEIFGINFIKL